MNKAILGAAVPSTARKRPANGGHVVFVVQVPFTPRTYATNDIPAFLARGIAVTVLDVSDIVQPTLTHDRSASSGMPDIEIVVVSDAASLAAQKSLLERADLIVCHVGTGFPTLENHAVLKAICRSGTPYAIPSSNIHPWAAGNPAGGGEGKGGLIQRLRRADIRNSLFTRLPLRLLGLRAADFVIHGGRRSDIPMRLVDATTHRILAHIQDYDVYLDVSAENPAVADEAVYIDVFLGHHPDTRAMRNVAMPDDPAYFYPRLRAFFDRVERELGLRVVVAAHPRADYGGMDDPFGGRRVIKGDTAGCVVRSRLVLACHSTANSYAVMFGKPVVVMATRNIMAHPLYRWVFASTAELLGQPLTYIDDATDADLSDAMTIDSGAYARFLEDFIKIPGTPREKYWNIVLDELVAAGVLGAASAESATTA